MSNEVAKKIYICKDFVNFVNKQKKLIYFNDSVID